MVGRAPTYFNPQENLTRAEMTAILNRMIPVKGATASSFKDIKGDEWYAQSIINMRSIGMLGGYKDNTFRSKDNIKRSEVMILLARAAKYNNEYKPVDGVDTILSVYKDSGSVPQWDYVKIKYSSG